MSVKGINYDVRVKVRVRQYEARYGLGGDQRLMLIGVHPITTSPSTHKTCQSCTTATTASHNSLKLLFWQHTGEAEHEFPPTPITCIIVDINDAIVRETMKRQRTEMGEQLTPTSADTSWTTIPSKPKSVDTDGESALCTVLQH